MSGQTAFEQLFKTLNKPAVCEIKKITHKQYQEWQLQTSFDIMRGLRYGQSFCNHFGIEDNILYYEFSWMNAEEYIKRTYLEKP